MTNLVYGFNEGNKDMTDILGIKGAGLCEMTKMGLPVPYGFILSTDAVSNCIDKGMYIDDELSDHVIEKLRELEKITGKLFGDNENPLILSVRLSSVHEMMGMTDSVLNIGFNKDNIESFAKKIGSYRCAYDSYIRFIRMYAKTVMNLNDLDFESIFSESKEAFEKESIDGMCEALEKHLKLVFDVSGKEIPTDPFTQLTESINGVISSWNNENAIYYRQLNRMYSDIVPSICIQEMVFGNSGEKSGVGEIFTRNPSTGQKKIFGEFLFDSQGLDIIDGKNLSHHIDIVSKKFPDQSRELKKVAAILENRYKDVQEIEFTIENSKLYVIQTKQGKRNSIAAAKIAVDMVGEGIIDKKTAIKRMAPEKIDKISRACFDEGEIEEKAELMKGMPASPGEAIGVLCFDEISVRREIEKGKPVILAMDFIDIISLPMVLDVDGIITVKGGVTSNMATIARRMNKCYIAGVNDVVVDRENRCILVDDLVINEGEVLSLDGHTGKIYLGKISRGKCKQSPEFETIIQWADEIRRLVVKADACDAEDVAKAVTLGAEGIGVFDGNKILLDDGRADILRKVIFSNDQVEKHVAYRTLFGLVKEDYKQVFQMIEDPSIALALMNPRVDILKEKYKEIDFDFVNDGGFRIALVSPEIYELQIGAMYEAAAEVNKNRDDALKLDVIIPNIDDVKELKYVINFINNVVDNLKMSDSDDDMMLGTVAVIDSPRAAVISGELAKYADGILFDVGKLTEKMVGITPYEMNLIRTKYRGRNIYPQNPFKTIDIPGTGQIMKHACDVIKKEDPYIKVGIFGLYGSDSESVNYVNSIGFDYISCSPDMIPKARIEAARAVVLDELKHNMA